jgi:hypothetical protein
VRRFTDPGVRQALFDRAAKGRLGTAEEIANSVLFLMSDGSCRITGLKMVIDGRMTARQAPFGPRPGGAPPGARLPAIRARKQMARAPGIYVTIVAHAARVSACPLRMDSLDWPRHRGGYDAAPVAASCAAREPRRRCFSSALERAGTPEAAMTP